jgi:flagellar protein FlbD
VIQVTRLNNRPFVINSDLIKLVEQAPDTLITLVSGEKMVVLESTSEIVDRIIQFRRSVVSGFTSAGSDPNLIAAAVGRKHQAEEDTRTSEETDRG